MTEDIKTDMSIEQLNEFNYNFIILFLYNYIIVIIKPYNFSRLLFNRRKQYLIAGRLGTNKKKKKRLAVARIWKINNE